MSGPPPADLKDWSKKMLQREVERLRAMLREHSESVGDDPRVQATTGAAITDVAGDPYARGSAVLDLRRAVLMESVDVVLVDRRVGEEPLTAMLSLGGRVNMAAGRVEHVYLFGTDGAAALVSQLVGLAQRAGGAFAAEFVDALQKRMDELP